MQMQKNKGEKKVYMGNKFFAELSRRLNIDGIELSAIDDKRLEVFLHGQPVLFLSPANDVFLLPAGSKNESANKKSIGK